MVIKDVERDDVPFICKTIGCQPVADVTALSPERYARALPVFQVLLVCCWMSLPLRLSRSVVAMSAEEAHQD